MQGLYFFSPNAQLDSEEATVHTQTRQTSIQMQTNILSWIAAARTRNTEVILMGDLHGLYQSDLESFMLCKLLTLGIPLNEKLLVIASLTPLSHKYT